MKRIVILISGRGSNMAAILDAGIPASAVISSRSDSAGLDIARSRGIPAIGLDHRNYQSRDDFDRALAEKIESFSPDFVILAGFMRILGDEFVKRYAGRLINIHPSLLPSFPGTKTHSRALEEGVRIHGCTVHFVTEKLDHGAIIIQAAVPVFEDDDEESLGRRVLEQEHRIYPQAVKWLIEGRLKIDKGRVRLDSPAKTKGELISPEIES